jgi:hypothetical protein
MRKAIWTGPRGDSGVCEGRTLYVKKGVRLLDAKYRVRRLPLESNDEQRLGRM